MKMCLRLNCNVVSRRQISGIKGSTSSCVELPNKRKIRLKLKETKQQAERKQWRKKRLAIKQKRIGFLHPNENSSCETDESV